MHSNILKGQKVNAEVTELSSIASKHVLYSFHQSGHLLFNATEIGKKCLYVWIAMKECCDCRALETMMMQWQVAPSKSGKQKRDSSLSSLTPET